MEETVQKHLRSIRILLVIALLVSMLSFGFSYVLFKEVSVPLETLRVQQLSSIENKVNTNQVKVDYLLSSRLNGRLDIGLQSTLLQLDEVIENSAGEIKTQAEKARAETKALLDQLRKNNGVQ